MTVEEILLLCGKIAAVCAIVVLYVDVILSIIKRRNIKLSILSLVFLSLATVLFVTATFIIKDGLASTVLSMLAIAFLAAYLICDIIVVVGNVKRRRAEKDVTATTAAEQDDAETTATTQDDK